MTWTQIKLFSRAAQQRKVEDYLMQAAIAHNPYSKDGPSAARLFSELRAERNRLSRGRDPKPGISMAQLDEAFGPIEMVHITPEEMAAKRLPRGVDQ